MLVAIRSTSLVTFSSRSWLRISSNSHQNSRDDFSDSTGAHCARQRWISARAPHALRTALAKALERIATTWVPVTSNRQPDAGVFHSSMGLGPLPVSRFGRGASLAGALFGWGALSAGAGFGRGTRTTAEGASVIFLHRRSR
jgi:hypothetical protein